MLKFNLQKNTFFDFKAQVPLQGVCGIFGDSGAGKTSLVHALTGLDKDFIGSVVFNDINWQSENNFIKTERRRIGVVFQEPRLFPHLNTLGNLTLAHNKNSLYSINELAKKLDFEALLKQPITTLSGGQKQRVAIARAVLTAPQLLVMDEPLSSLDKHSRTRVLPFIQALSKQIPILYITHSMQELFYLANNMILINQGKVEAVGHPQKLFIDPALSLVKHAHSGLLIEVTNISWDAEHAILQGEVDGQQFYVTMPTPLSSERETIQIKVESKDIIIATQAFHNSSLQNCLQSRIEHIEKISPSHILLTLNLGKQKLLAKITLKSLQQLQLKVGQLVFSYVKAVSIINET
ncbi:molybdenum ABC transporter ATP-binding protein [Psychromonas sp. KJ10-10]|uniref:molybdenum ABC transporter ATP-binding protein n=1 Tax=Psychromonas sp. KJ10-10 TaxID=3391823 RepID=UPI0039B62751